jgi:hypothetical protein
MTASNSSATVAKTPGSKRGSTPEPSFNVRQHR